MHRFNLSIGDWSGDGHGQQDVYLIESNKPVQEVREAYFRAKKKLQGCLCPENFMKKHGDSSLPVETYEAAKALGYDLLKGFEEITDETFEYPDIGTGGMADYTLWFIKQGDPELELTRVEVDTFAFYGYDEQKRHIGFIGYALLGN